MLQFRFRNIEWYVDLQSIFFILDIVQCLGRTCSEHATCQFASRFFASCQCNPGFTGDGETCTGIQHWSLQQSWNLKRFASFLYFLVINKFEVKLVWIYVYMWQWACDESKLMYCYVAKSFFYWVERRVSYHLDIDECLTKDTNNCHQNAVCINTEGSYRCECSSGFIGDGRNVCNGRWSGVSFW